MPETKGTALFVSYMFPPVGGVGTIRTVKFIRYLKEYGWDVVVLTVDEPAYAVYDETLFDDIPPQTHIYRTRAFQPTARYFASKRQQASAPDKQPSRGLRARISDSLRPVIRKIGRFVVQNVMLPDDKIGWFPFAIREGQRILQAHPIDIIFSSSSPLTTHAIAHHLSRQNGIPWVADFRDPMTGEGSVVKRSRFHQWVFARLERRWVQQAMRVISVTEPMQKLFADRYTNMPTNKWQVITNGYDEANFANVAPPDPSPYFEMHYIGSLYQGIAPSLMPLFASIAQLIETNPIARQQFRFIFTGNIDNYFLAHIQAGIEQYGLEDIVHVHPPVSHQDAIQIMLRATVLFVTLHHDPKVSIAIHVKIFEYLRAHQPILALLPPSAARDLLAQMDGAVIIDPDDSEAIAQQLEAWFTAWQAGELPVPKNKGHEQYERRALTQKLAHLFDELKQESQR